MDQELRNNLSLALVQEFTFGCLMGRPVFFGMVACRPDEQDTVKPQSVLELLKKKILKEAKFRVQALAVLGCIASIEISAGSANASS